MPAPPAPPSLPRGFRRLVLAQGLSALADHALLILAIARLLELGAPAWWAPLLKFGFTAAYVLLAPLVGVLADAASKPRVMRAAQLLKLLGTAGLLAGGTPGGVLLAYALAGLGAALHSPAKYGWVAESVPPGQLVRANGWLEASIVVAALAGAGLGGLLLAPAMLGPEGPALLRELATGLAGGLPQAGGPAGSALGPALALLLALQALATLAHLGLPTPARRGSRPPRRLQAGRLLRGFLADGRRLTRDPEGALALGVTVLTWGAGGALQFLVLRWGQETLGLGLDRAAALQALVGLGVIVGALLAGRWARLTRAPRLLPLGLLLGALLPALALVEHLALGLTLLVLVGALAGALIVPMNALMQARGLALLGPGRTVAVQNGAENLAMGLTLAASSAATAAGLGAAPQAGVLGALLLAGVLLLRRHAARPSAPPPADSFPAPAAARGLPSP